MKISIEVENIKCGGCVNTISKSIMENKNVTDVLIDKESQVITIELKEAQPKDVFVKQLTSMGYPERGHNSIGSKVKSYVSCAIGKLD